MGLGDEMHTLQRAVFFADWLASVEGSRSLREMRSGVLRMGSETGQVNEQGDAR